MNFHRNFFIIDLLDETNFCLTIIKSHITGCENRTKSVKIFAGTYNNDKKTTASNKKRSKQKAFKNGKPI